MILGLTGGIGCGKSTAAHFFEEEGFRRIDCDAIVRDEVLTSEPVVREIAAHFGPGVLTQDRQSVDRPRLANSVFGSSKELLWLEQLIHPEVHRIWTSRVASDPDADWVVEVPLLFEKDLNKWFDFVVCVACCSQVQLARLEQRGLNRTLAGQRISRQLPLARKIELSDFVLSNDGTPEFLKRQVGLLVARCRELNASRTTSPF